MAGSTLRGDDSVSNLSKNSCNCEELMHQCCLKLKSELQEMQTELKSAIAVGNLLNEEFDTVHGMKGSKNMVRVFNQQLIS